MNWEFLLFYRWLAFNLIGLALLWVAHVQGMLVPIYRSDTSYIVSVVSG